METQQRVRGKRLSLSLSSLLVEMQASIGVSVLPAGTRIYALLSAGMLVFHGVNILADMQLRKGGSRWTLGPSPPHKLMTRGDCCLLQMTAFLPIPGRNNNCFYLVLEGRQSKKLYKKYYFHQKNWKYESLPTACCQKPTWTCCVLWRVGLRYGLPVSLQGELCLFPN